jgi:hypothetical protein
MLFKRDLVALFLLCQSAEAQSSTEGKNATEVTSITTSQDNTITGICLNRRSKLAMIIAR